MIKHLLGIFAIFSNLVITTPIALAQSTLSSGALADTPVQSILPNGGFEYSKTKWSATGGTFSIVTSGVNLGLGKAGATWDSNAAGQVLRSDLITVPNALQSTNGLLSCTIKIPSGTGTHILRVSDGSNILATRTINSRASFFPSELNFIFPGSGSIRAELVSVAADEPLAAIDDCYIGKAYNVTQALNIPVGTVFSVATPTCPVGSVAANGATLSRTGYADLYSAIGTTHGSGDGSSTFHIPDYRGRFLRGVSGGTGRDPDAGSRSAMNAGGSTGDSVGTLQGQATAKNGLSISDATHQHTGVTRIGTPSTRYSTASLAVGTNSFAGLGDNTVQNTNSSFSNITLNAGDSETRPINAYVNYCIQHAPSVTVFSPEKVLDSTGTVITVAMTSCPVNSLEAAGTAVSRTTYAKLFAKMGTIHGSGDGSTTFNLPDYRGRFLRGHDNGAGRDPNAASRTAMNSGGAVANNVGSIQGQATAKNGLALTDPGHNHSITGYSGGGAASTLQATTFSVVYNSNATSTNTTGITLGAGDSETRPINAYVKYCVIFDGTIEAPQMLGSLTTGSASQERIERATLDVDASPSIVNQSGSWVSSIVRNSSGDFSVTLSSGYFSDEIVCSCNSLGSSPSNSYYCAFDNIGAASFRIIIRDANGANLDGFRATILCMGEK